MLLVPLQRRARPINADIQVVLVADADLRGVQDPFGAALEPQEDVAVVVELAAPYEGGQVRAELLDLRPVM
jgi:hypothetical protein